MVIHTVKGFGTVNKAEVDVFLGLSSFFDDPVDVGNLISGSSAFSKIILNIWKFTVHILLKPGLENFELFDSMWDERNCGSLNILLALPYFGIWMKTDLFQSCGHCWVFQICWHIECSTWQHRLLGLQQCSWNSITSPSLFTAMLPKAHLTLHSRMALDERSHHYDYLGHEDLFVQFFCVFLSPLLNIFCFC